ncbi:MAG: glycosyl hydrolase family 17 protein [Planctomycetota bacterium]
MSRCLIYALTLALGWSAACTASADAEPTPRQDPFVKRAFSATSDGEWIGQAICYGPHRDGQSPGGEQPTREQLLEDLQIMSRHWKMLRMYGSQGATEIVLELIQEHELDMKVVVGAWISTEVSYDEEGNVLEHFPDEVAANRAEVATAIRLANAYPEIVAAVTIGNETQVEWSAHKVKVDVLIEYIRQTRAAITAPVSTADVATYWRKPQSQPLAAELDFIMTHIYAKWNKQTIDTAMGWTLEQYHAGLATHPGYTFVIGEAGWATNKHTGGIEGQQIHGVASEANQVRFHRDFTAWTEAEQIATFWFQAFDEKWKGADNPNGVEKHWGLYFSDRTPKQALRDATP